MKTEAENRPSTAFIEYERLLRALHDLDRIGKEDSPEAEEIRDQMDVPYAELTEAEIVELKRLSEALYTNSARPRGVDCWLSEGVTIYGSISSRGKLTIDGHVDGEIISDGELVVGRHARIHADIKSRSIIVYGGIEGNLLVGERCELKETGVFHGDLKAARIIIDEGAEFIGTSEVHISKLAPAPARVVQTIALAGKKKALA